MIEDKKENSIKKRLINFFKNPKEVISFFLPIIIAICLLIPLPYYVKLGGGILEIDDKISIEGEPSKNDNFIGALYVRESKAVVFTYLISCIVPSFDHEKIENVVVNDEDTEGYNYREKLYFTSSTEAATKVAFEKAGKEVKASSLKYIVIYIDKKAKTELKVGDEIIKIDGKEVKSYDEIMNLIKKSGDNIKITVIRDGKKKETNSKTTVIENEKKIGIVISNYVEYESNPEVKFDLIIKLLVLLEVLC